MLQTSVQIPSLGHHKCNFEHLPPINWIAHRLQMGLLSSQLILLGKNYVYTHRTETFLMSLLVTVAALLITHNTVGYLKI